MKIIITEKQKDLLFENKQNDFLIEVIKEDGWESASELVGGVENLKKILGIETPMDFLNIFTDLDVVESKEKSNLTLYRYEKGYNIMIHNRNQDIVYFSYNKIWGFLIEGFELRYIEIQKLMREWLSEVYDLRGVEPQSVGDGDHSYIV